MRRQQNSNKSLHPQAIRRYLQALADTYRHRYRSCRGNGADPADETGGVNSSGFTAITVTHLESNNALVRSRICSAIRVSEGGYVPHAQIIEVIVSLAIEAVLAPS